MKSRSKIKAALLAKRKITKAIKELPVPTIDAAELFSYFTANIIQKKTRFTR